MKHVINWCLSHIEVLTSLGIGCISLIIVIFKPRTKANTWDSVLKDIIGLIPGYIYSAETLLINGESKKKMVIATAIKYAKTCLRRSLSVDEENHLTNVVSSQIEAILYCPTKKGGIGREA